MLRADPLIFPSTILSMMAGRWYKSTSREATIPITPRCQFSLYSTMVEVSSMSKSLSICSIASFMVLESVSRRFRLMDSNSCACDFASAIVSEIISFTAVLASPIRPAALILGPIENTILDVFTSSFETLIRSSKALIPILGLRWIICNPAFISTRFSSIMGTMSEAMEMATRSRNLWEMDWGRPSLWMVPWISLKPTPAPESPSKG